jgi:hypothetical protein
VSTIPEEHEWHTSRNKMAFTAWLFAVLERLPSRNERTFLATPGSASGGPSRWKQGQEIWYPLKPVLVVEVTYDHVMGRRFGHGAKLVRWRPDKVPGDARWNQLTQKPPNSLRLLGIDFSGKPREDLAGVASTSTKARRGHRVS